MTGQRVGCVRVSTLDQNPDRQLSIDVDRTFIDHASGRGTNRTRRDARLRREGDTIVVHSMDRLARNLDDLRRIVFDLVDRSIRVEFVKESLNFGGDQSAMAKLLLSVMGAFAEFERAIIRERQTEGIELAKKRGVYKGRKRSLTNDQAAELRHRAATGESKTDLAAQFGISRQTVYQYLKTAS